MKHYKNICPECNEKEQCKCRTGDKEHDEAPWQHNVCHACGWSGRPRPKQASITLDIEKGDTLLGGRFKNVKHIVEDIGTDTNGQPTVNGMKLLSFRIDKKMPKSAAYMQGMTEKVAQAGVVNKVIAARSPFELGRLGLMGGVGYGLGTAGGLIHPGDPEHRTFSSQLQGVGGALGTMAGGAAGYGLADEMMGAGTRGWRAGALRVILPFILGSAGLAGGGTAGHVLSKSRFGLNETWRKTTGQPTYEETHKARIKAALIAAIAATGLAGAGYAGYSMYNKDRE